MAFLPRGTPTVWINTDQIALSLHIDGRHINHTDRSQFDPEAGTEERFVVTMEQLRSLAP